MIDKAAFKSAWRNLSARFGREINADQAAMYYDYLSQIMDTADFLQSCNAIWATAKWFPRPADFLTVRAAEEWPLVLKCANEYRPPDGAWHETFKLLSPRSRAAVKRLGGIDAVKDQLARNSLKIKEAFLSAFEEEATAEVLALPAPATRNLPPAA